MPAVRSIDISHAPGQPGNSTRRICWPGEVSRMKCSSIPTVPNETSSICTIEERDAANGKYQVGP